MTLDGWLFELLSAKNSLLLDLLLPFDEDDEEDEEESLSLSFSFDNEFLLKFLLCFSLSFELLGAEDKLELLFLLLIGLGIKLVPAPAKLLLTLNPPTGIPVAVPTTADNDGLLMLKFIPDVEAAPTTVADDDEENI